VNYVPKPIDTARVVVPHEIAALAERLARNAHEVWAAERLAAGWRFGPRRDDIRKEHPSLVPYDDLSEDEKQYDREVSMQTIKAILALGFRIVRDPEVSAP
jgi:hypothetical protein